jgi:hypothetical protein
LYFVRCQLQELNQRKNHCYQPPTPNHKPIILVSYRKDRVVSKLFVEFDLIRFIFCFNDVNMLKGIQSRAPTGMPELWKNGTMIEDGWINAETTPWNLIFIMPLSI